MLSVPPVKIVSLLILAGLLLGCLGSEQTKKDSREPETLIDSAKVKVDAADQYLLEGEGGKAASVLEDAKEDLEGSLLSLNSTVDEDGAAGVMKAKESVEAALNSLEGGDLLEARYHLEVAGEELLRAAIIFVGGNDRLAPEKYTVENRELPLTYYGHVDGVYLGYQLVPHNVAAAARESFYSYHETGERVELERGIFLVEYLISTSTERDNGNFIVWENNFEWPVYNLSSGWIGALSQAGCLKALMLAYQATGEKKYKDFSEKAINAFEVDVSDGGLKITRIDDTGSYVWFPEYAKEEPPFVLNGFITVVIWLGDYHTYTDSVKAKELYEDGLISIRHYLPLYEQGKKWSYYDAIGHRSNAHYHNLHVKQMAVLYDLTGWEIFREYQEKWGSAVIDQ
jgi:hypothetical protein